MAYSRPVKATPVSDWHDPTPHPERVRRSGNEGIETVPKHGGLSNDRTEIKRQSFESQQNNENIQWLAENVSDSELSRRAKNGDGFALSARLLKKSKGQIYNDEGYLVQNKTPDELDKEFENWALAREEV